MNTTSIKISNSDSYYCSNQITSKNKLTFTDSPQQEEGVKMFYSQCLLSSKGPLNNIWVAGYFFKRLKKRQITETDIPFSVDKILLEGLPNVTYRVLAYLLLGVVRIYSKKAEYLYNDCDQTVSEINRFSLTKKPVPFRDIVRFTHSISLPQRYELDTFQLEVTNDAKKDHVKRNKDILLKEVDLGHQDKCSQYALDSVILDYGQDCFEEGPLHFEEFDNDLSSSGINQQENGSSSMQTPEKPKSDKGTSNRHTPPDNVLSPHHMEIDVDMSPPSDEVTKVELGTKEKLREMRFNQDEGEGLGADMICELDVELLNLINDYEAQNTVRGNEEVQEKPILENHVHVVENEDKVPSPLEKTRDSDHEEPPAATTPHFEVVPSPVKVETLRKWTARLKAVRAPVKEEIVRKSKKRKCIFDEVTVLSNEIMKQSINDASSLICKRTKVLHNVIDIWRFQHIPILVKNFSEPLIPCAAMEIKNIKCLKATEKQPSFNAAAGLTVETVEIPEKTQVPVSPLAPTLAPGTPVRCSTSTRVFGSVRGTDSDGEDARSYGNLERDFVPDEEDPGPKLMNEMDATEGDTQEPHKNKDGWSTRTRTVATYLHRVCQEKKQKGGEAATLLPIVKRKTKGESARLFFEILVLSTGGFMKVKQEKAYEDVVLRETRKIEATLQNS